MLLERAAGLAAKVESYRRLKAIAHEAELVTTRVIQVREAAELLSRARTALGNFTQAGIPTQFVPASASDLAEKAVTLRNIAAQDPAALANPPFNVSHEFSNRLKGIASAAHRSIEDGWRAFIGDRSLSGSDDVLEALNRLPQMRAGVARIRQCRQRVQELAGSVPSDPSNAVKVLKDLEAEHSAAWAELTADSIPPSVLEFLRRCAADGAPLANLNEEVRGWLEARQLIGSFRIRIG